jgi:sodium/proline symporter
MPAVLLEIFPPSIAALLITGAIAAMISTADSLLILSATELSENLIKPALKGNHHKIGSLKRSRLVTALLALIALTLAYFSPSDLIFTMVSYVWAGIGGTFSVVILLTLFWPRYNGRAVIATIVSGIAFTIIWISTNMEQIVSARLLTFFVALLVAILTTYFTNSRENHSRSPKPISRSL